MHHPRHRAVICTSHTSWFIASRVLSLTGSRSISALAAHQTNPRNVERHRTYVWSRLAPDREGGLQTVLLIGATADPFEGDSVEIERALTDLGVRNGGARPS